MSISKIFAFERQGITCVYWGTYASTTSHYLVWFWSGGINRLLFFENEQGGNVAINRERYHVVLNEFLFPKIEEHDMDDIWFQQDLLRRQRNHRSFAHSSLNFFSWRVLKNNCYANHTETNVALKYEIEVAINAIGAYPLYLLRTK